MILKYYTNDESIICISDEDIDVLKNEDNLNDIIDELLINKDSIINIIGLCMILDLKLEYKSINLLNIINIVDLKKKAKLYNNILHFYNEKEGEIKRESIPRCVYTLIENGI